MPNITKNKITYIEAVVKMHEGRWWAFSVNTGNPLHPIHKRSLEIKSKDTIYFQPKHPNPKLVYTLDYSYEAVEIVDIAGILNIVLKNDDERRTQKLSDCNKCYEGQIVYGRVIQDEDDTKAAEELDNGEWHSKVKYFSIQWHIKPEDDSDINQALSDAFSNALKNRTTILQELNTLGYKVEKA